MGDMLKDVEGIVHVGTSRELRSTEHLALVGS